LNDPIRSRRSIGAALCAATLLTACSSGGGSTEVVDPVATTITISPEIVAFSFLGETRNLTAQVLDQEGSLFTAPVTWASGDDAVVSIDATGKARAEANGSATITASAAGLTASITIQVRQTASVIVVQQGDEQDGPSGLALSDTIVARITDLGGTPVEGVEVRFQPDAVSGSVSLPTFVTGTDGLAATVWTLGADFGCQSLDVAIDARTLTVTAYATSDVPTPDLILLASSPASATLRVCEGETPRLSRVDPTSQDVLDVQGIVRNQGDLATGAFRVVALVGGIEVGSADVVALGPFGEFPFTIEVGRLDPGMQTVRVEIDPDDLVTELIESNNAGERGVTVKDQAALTVGTPVTGLTASPGEELLFVVDIPPGSEDALVIETTDASSGPLDDLDLFVHGGTRPSTRSSYDACISAGPTTVERCQIVFPEGRYHILLHAWDDAQLNPTGFSGVTLTLTLGNTIIPFDIDLVFVERGTPEQDQAFEDAAARWMQIIRGDIPEQDFTGNAIPAGACFEGQPRVGDVIDDVRIFVTIRAIDGGGGTLAQAGPCLTRQLSDLPIFGAMTFDEVDLEGLGEDMLPVVLHEMGHVLGLGTIWDDRGLLADPSLNNPGADTHFRGEAAIQAFDDAGGTVYDKKKVPVENQAGPGSGDAHWRESVMDREVMTPFIEAGGAKPLSAITIRSMEDLGYGVDVTQADPYTLPLIGAPMTAPSLMGGISLMGDIRAGPITVVDPKGRIVGVRW
jgi:hypothetical protein